MSEKQIIQTDRAPAAIGPYSQAVQSGNTIYLSGQIPLDPATMEIVGGGIRAEAEQVFRNLTAVAEAAGGSLENFVRITIYLPDLGNFGVVNEVMAEHFSAPYPARATIGVAALPKGAQVEVDAVMVL